MLSWGTLGATVLTMLTGGACTPAFLSVDDAVALGDKPVTFVACAERPQMLGLRSDIEHVTVSFLVDGREIRRADTGDNGRASVEFRLPRPDAPSFEARAIVEGRELQTRGAIYAWREDRPIIAVDIDNTISRTDYEELILKRQDVDSSPIPGSREGVTALADEFYIAYVTARPRIYVEKTRWWLNENRFPPGPVVTAPRLRDLIQHKTLKRKMFATLRRRWPNLLIGIGNNWFDADACGANGMLALIVNPNSKRAYGLHAIVLGDWAEVGRFFAANRSILGRPEELRKAVRGEVMLSRFVIPWRHAGDD
jgi:hypothetical protein